MLLKGVTASDRLLNFLPLPAYLPGAAEMFMNKLNLESCHAPMIEILCPSLGHHGRMLEVLHDILDPASTDLTSKALKASFIRDAGTAVDSILREVAARGGIHYFQRLQLDPLSLTVPVCHALLGQSLFRDENLQG